MKVLIFGASGMLGHTLYYELSQKYEVLGTCRSNKWHKDLVDGVDCLDFEQVENLVANFKPDFILNAVGIIKQLKEANNKLLSIQINSLWPHELCRIAEKHNAKVVHFSTDCVFSGKKGNYHETDLTDSRDTYGLSKLLGEVDYPHALTLRTSIIGHELQSKVSLVDWFLSQEEEVQGFTQAIYTGFPTVTVARFLDEFVFKNWISGVWHFSSEPISKFDLLHLVKDIYDKKIKVIPSSKVKIDRSLNSDKLRSRLGFSPKPWSEMVREMRSFYLESGLYK